eukprot:6908443-Pyramimonas_sp.AAC.1
MDWSMWFRFRLTGLRPLSRSMPLPPRYVTTTHEHGASCLAIEILNLRPGASCSRHAVSRRVFPVFFQDKKQAEMTVQMCRQEAAAALQDKENLVRKENACLDACPGKLATLVLELAHASEQMYAQPSR